MVQKGTWPTEEFVQCNEVMKWRDLGKGIYRIHNYKQIKVIMALPSYYGWRRKLVSNLKFGPLRGLVLSFWRGITPSCAMKVLQTQRRQGRSIFKFSLFSR